MLTWMVITERDLADQGLATAGNGEVRQEFSIVLTAGATCRRPTPGSETSLVVWAALTGLKGFQMSPVHAPAHPALH